MATEQELSDFLKSVEKRAFKRSIYHVRDEDAALDIVQDSMMKLAEHYGDKPVGELPMLFQRILSNTTLDWFRRQKTRKAVFSNMSDFESGDGGLDRLLAVARLGRAHGVDSVVTSTMETTIGIAVGLHAAALVQTRGLDSGLATATFFADNLAPPGAVVGGCLCLPPGLGLGVSF